ncbi:MAG: tetratricopeptide repeat protein, partial [Rhodospirillales bacterium]|nr:tetratricopeptide repeat protein [Rhodospirillales bacterium]
LGVLALQTGNADAAKDLITRAAKMAPETAETHSNLGLVLKHQGDLDAAIIEFRAAIYHDPRMAEAHSNLGEVLREMDRFDEAAQAFRQALEIVGDNPDLNLNLGAALIEVDDNEGALRVLAKVLEQSPDMAAAHYNMGKAYFNLRKFDEAAIAYEMAIEQEPHFNDARHNLAHALLAAGRLDEGWAAYEWRWKSPSKSSRPREFPVPVWNGDSLAGKNLLVWGEQGLGDEMLFAGLIGEIADQAGTCVVECDERLVSLFRRSLGNVEVVARANPSHPLTQSPDLDVQLAMGDLAKWTRPNLAGFSPLGRYLLADPARVQEFRARYRSLGMGLKVGISWASRPPKGITLPELGVFLTQPGLHFVNLQYGDHASEIAAAEKLFGIEIFSDPQADPSNDLDGLAAQIDALDAVLTIQNTTLFLAGALDKPVFGLIKSRADWRWFGLDESRWHGDVNLYRQEAPGHWEGAVGELTTDFSTRFLSGVF